MINLSVDVPTKGEKFLRFAMFMAHIAFLFFATRLVAGCYLYYSFAPNLPVPMGILSEILGGVLIGIAIFPSQFYSVKLDLCGTPRYANFSFSKFIIVIFVFPIVIGILFDIGLLLKIIMFIKHYIDRFVIFVDNECVASAVRILEAVVVTIFTVKYLIYYFLIIFFYWILLSINLIIRLQML
jgi:hypothetical protein